MADADDTPDGRPVSPEARARHDGIGGTPVDLAGRAWLLADFIPALGGVWDRVFDQNVIRGAYEVANVRMAASRLLLANYDLSPDEAVALIFDATPAALVPAVEAALSAPTAASLSYSEWAASGLIASGIDPATVPPRLRPHVLDHLEAAGKVLPREECIASVVAARKREKLLQSVGLDPSTPLSLQRAAPPRPQPQGE